MPGYALYRDGDSLRPSLGRSYSYVERNYHERQRTRPHCDEDCAGVKIDLYNDLLDRERSSRLEVKNLSRENRKLKNENARLASLCERDEDITTRARRRIDALKAKLDRRAEDLRALQEEKEMGDTRIRVLTGTMSDQDHMIAELKAENDRLSRTLYEDGSKLLSRTAELEKANRTIEHLRQELNYSSPHRRWWR
ncbi:hypothetical protein GGS20DRAFT_198356 [Poronia punctata]|nr:hypothetical protein GGS20DRAFT_198356 [Poronia punctata]